MKPFDFIQNASVENAVVENFDERIQCVEMILREVITEFGKQRFAMSLLSDDYLASVMPKAA